MSRGRFHSCGLLSIACVLSASAELSAQAISLADADVIVQSEFSLNQFGMVGVNAAGDVNHDGFQDFICSARDASTLGRSANGRVYVIFGSDSLPSPFDLADSTGDLADRVLVIDGKNHTSGAEGFGQSCAGIGDFNDDGIDDFAVSAENINPFGVGNSGAVYVFFGSESLPDTIDMAVDFDSSTGVVIGGESGSKIGSEINGAGDFNDDGIPDLLIGGAVNAYIVFGSASPPSEIELEGDLTGIGVELKGVTSVSDVDGLGDFNGDLIDDVIVCQSSHTVKGANTGRCWIVFGHIDPPGKLSLAKLVDTVDDDDDGGGMGTATDGIIIDGAAAGDRLGNAAGATGDTDGDGFADVIIGALEADCDGRSNAGEAYVIFGGDDRPETIDASDLVVSIAGSDVTLGITFCGPQTTGRLGNDVDGIGDIDGDGLPDYVIGGDQIDLMATDSGAAYVFLGGEAFPDPIVGDESDDDLDDFATVYRGDAANDKAGRQVAGVGDVNDDGAPDFLVSSFQADPEGRTDAGELYLIFGDAVPPVVDLACASDGTNVSITWSNPEKYDSIEIHEDGSLIATLDGTATSHKIKRASAGKHTYGVVAVRDGDESSEVECTLDVEVDPPLALECGSDGSEVSLSWTNGQTYSGGIEVLRDGLVIASLAGTATSFSEPLPEPGVYEYCVRGVHNGDTSSQACCTVTVPMPPVDFECEVNGSSVTLSWMNAETYSELQISRDGVVIVTRPGDSTGFTDLGVTPGPHVYSIAAVIDGDLSESVSCAIAVVAPATLESCTVEGNIPTFLLGFGECESLHVFVNGSEVSEVSPCETEWSDVPRAPGTYVYGFAVEVAGVLSDVVECEVTVLEPVGDLECSALEDDVSLFWSNSATQSYDSIKIYRNMVLIATLDGAATFYLDEDVAAGVYEYWVVACIPGSTALATACLVEVLEAPADVTCIAAGDDVTLEWTNASDYEAICILRNGTLIATLGEGVTSYVDSVSPGTYVYTVVGKSGSSSASTECELVAPGAPFGLDCSVIGNEATLTWTNGDSYDSVSILVDGVVVELVPGASTSATIGPIESGPHTICVVGVIGGSGSDPACCDVVLPLAVMDLECFALGDDVFLSWTNAEFYTSITIRRDGVTIATLLGTLTSFVDTDVPVGDYVYEVVSNVGAASASPVSCDVHVLGPIADLDCTADAGTVTLTWTNGDEYETIEIRRNRLVIATLGGDATSYDDENVSPGHYRYEVVGLFGDDTSPAVHCEVDVPAPPFGLTCTLLGGTDVRLDWENDQLGDSIEISRESLGGGGRMVLASIPGSSSTYTDSPVAPGNYRYCLVNVIDDNRSVPVCCDVAVPSAPIELECVAMDGGVELSWTNTGDYGSLVIRRNGVIVAAIPGSLESFFDPDLPGGSYAYEVTGFIDGFESSAAICMITVPDAVVDLECFFGGSSTELTWTLPMTYDAILVFRNNVLLDTLEGDDTGYTDFTVPPGLHTYTIIGVVGADHSSAASCTIEVLEQPVDLACRGVAGTAELSWTNSGTYRAIEVLREGIVIATLPGDAESYTDSTAPAGAQIYCVRGLAGGSVSRDVCCEVAILEAPADLTCAVDGSAVTLSWTIPEFYDHIVIRQDGVIVVALPGTATEFTVVGVAPGAHIFGVEGRLGVDSSPEAICEVEIVAPVDAVTCTAVGDMVHIEWDSIVAPNQFELSQDGSAFALVDGTTRSFDVGPLDPGSYVFCVRASNGDVLSDPRCCTIAVLIDVFGFECSAMGDTVHLSWSNGQAYGSIEVFRDGGLIATLSGAATFHSDLAVPSGSHSYELVATSSDGQSTSGAATCSVEVLDPIVDLTCTVDGPEVSLSWTNGSAYDQIEIRRNGALVVALGGGETSYVDSVIPGTYLYLVTGILGSSASAAATCEVVDPGAPSGLTCSAEGAIGFVAWTNGDLYDSVQVLLYGVVAASLGGGESSHTLTGLEAGTHEICVVGIVSDGASSAACCLVTVPLGISGLVCTASGDDVTLHWTNSESYALVHISRDGGLIASIPGNLESYTDTGLAPGTYGYSIAGELGGGTTDPVTCDVRVLEPIGDLECAADGGAVTIEFQGGKVYDSIEVRRNRVLVATLGGGAQSFEEDGLPPGVYTYTLRGILDGSETDLATCVVVVPAPPAGLECTLTDGEDVHLDWENTELGDNVLVIRDGVQIASLSGSASTYTDSNRPAGIDTYCLVTVIDGNRSTQVCCTVTIPREVTGVACTSTVDGVLVSWTNPEVFDSIQVLRDGVLVVELSGTQTSYLDDSVGPGTYTYAVVSITDGYASAPVDCTVTVPDPVVNLTCELGPIQLGSIVFDVNLEWLPPAGATQIQVYRNGDLIATLGGGATGYTDEISGAGRFEYAVVVIDGTDASRPAICELVVLAPPQSLSCCVEDGTVELCWENPLEYDSIQIFRGGVLRATLDGDATCYSETLAINGYYAYEVIGSVGDDSSAPATCLARKVGAISNLTCTQGTPTCVNSDVVLAWQNPEEFDSVEIYRDGDLIATTNGAAESYVDLGIGGNHEYEVVGVLVADFCTRSSSNACDVDAGLNEFLRGNANGDSLIDIADPVFVLNYLFQNGPDPACFDSADFNDDGQVNIADPVFAVMYLFQGGAAPPAPFRDEGTDPTCDLLDCGE